jgi:hypothetical protein
MCEQAQAYHYDYLCERSRECIPEEMLAHINQCRFCRTEVNRLKAELTGTQEDVGQRVEHENAVAVANLKLHFDYIGAPITCEDVRPFLPSLADPALEVGVPTPITVHLDKCQQCSDDLETIRRLRLTHKQLCRLGQLFAEQSNVNEEFCAKTKNVISSVGTMVFKGISVEALRHLCVCPDCREQLYKYRASKAEKLYWNTEESPKPCDAISTTGIFDYIVPYGIDPGKDQHARFPQSLTAHLIECRKCLEKMQELHKTVYGILQRAESGIVTCLKVDSAKRDSIISSPDNLYDDWPIEVEVFDKSSKTVDTMATKSDGTGLFVAKSKLKLSQKRLMLSIRPLIKPVVAAAAILIVALLVFRGSVVNAVGLDRVYEVLEGIKNVYTITSAPQKLEPLKEVWVSKELNVRISKTATKCVLWDLRDKTVKSKSLETNLVKTEKMSKEALVHARKTMNVPWGLLPFNTISTVRDISDDAIWQQVPDESLNTMIPNTQVYELIWTEKIIGGSIMHNKWRGYLDIKTTLPRRIERWQRLPREDEYELLIATEVVLPTTVEVQAAIRNAGF